MSSFHAPRRLQHSDQLDGFECRSEEQSAWLHRHARQSDASGSTSVMVVTEQASPTVVAYYAWRMAHVDTSALPPRFRKGSGRHPQPAALLARLGVDSAVEGHGLGHGLMLDAIHRMIELREDIGCRGLLIHSESAESRSFFLHALPVLQPSPTDERHLLLRYKDARRTLLG